MTMKWLVGGAVLVFAVSVGAAEHEASSADSGNMDDSMRALDTNNDGMISRDEAEAGEDSEFSERFDEMDRNKDDTVSEKERDLYVEGTEGTAAEAGGENEDLGSDSGNMDDSMRALDTNNDGMISRDEAEAGEDSEFSERFDEMDRNKDDTVSEKEHDLYVEGTEGTAAEAGGESDSD